MWTAPTEAPGVLPPCQSQDRGRQLPTASSLRTGLPWGISDMPTYWDPPHTAPAQGLPTASPSPQAQGPGSLWLQLPSCAGVVVDLAPHYLPTCLSPRGSVHTTSISEEKPLTRGGWLPKVAGLPFGPRSANLHLMLSAPPVP